jgi:ribosomal protein S17E
MAVKPKYIKDLGRKIYKEYSEDVTTNFDRNKQIVKQSTNVETI